MTTAILLYFLIKFIICVMAIVVVASVADDNLPLLALTSVVCVLYLFHV